MNDNVFDSVLADGEEVIRIFKPNKTKTYFSTITGILFFLLFIVIFVGSAALPLWLGATDENGNTIAFLNIMLMTFIPVTVFVVFTILSIIFTGIRYKHTFYAYTNKRVITRSGLFGVDYRSLDIDMIGAIDVDVTFGDKIINKDTGSITFGSMSLPMSSNSSNGNGRLGYRFANVEHPYAVYKEIKKYIDNIKTEKNIK